MIFIIVAILVIGTSFTSCSTKPIEVIAPPVEVPRLPEDVEFGWKAIIEEPQDVYDLATNCTIYAYLAEKYKILSDELYRYIEELSAPQFT